MTKFKDKGNISQVIGDLTGKKPEIIDEKQAFNYLMPTVQKLYNLIQPYQSTVQSNNVVFFSSNEENDDNAYWIQISDLYSNASSTFANLIDLRRNMLQGAGGLIPVVPETDALYQPTIDFINQENEMGESLQDIWLKLCLDYSLMETYFLECLYSQEGKVASVVHIQPNKVRAVANPENPNIDLIARWELSNSWGLTNKAGKYRKPATSGIPVANWNPSTWATDGARQILNCKRYTAGGGFYTIPSFNAILPYAELQAQLATFSLNTVAKGFVPSSIVVLNGNPSKKEKDEFISRFKTRYTGANGERILFIWTTNEGEKPEIMPFNTVDQTPLIEALNKLSVEAIASGMGAPFELVGAGGGVSLQTDANRLVASYNYYLQSRIKPMLGEMLKTLNKIFLVNQLSQVKVDVEKLTSEAISPITPVQNQPVNNVKDLMK